jgi:asparagine synthase (glutamine-hydrolysing)
MCGIAGKVSLAQGRPVDRSEIAAMLRPIHHRGPDAQGIYLDNGVGLGHARLSIIDVASGIQPMTNEDETVWIVFNGEIYNFQELREQLIGKGHVFRNRSDTEVIIHLYEEHGTDCVKYLRGMFAFAIWDRRRRRLFIARDRVGIKPLYYCQTKHSVLFASEFKAILTDPDVPRDFDQNALRRFLSFFYVPGELTLFRHIKKLLPGHTMTVEGGKVRIERYWDLKFTEERYNRSFDDVVEELYELLRATVRDHMIADVPVGVLLSGGVDSSAVLNFAVQGTEKKVKTFTVGFGGEGVVDERPFARLAAERFGTEHHEMSITAEDFWNFLPSYVWHMEEPVCEPPAVALYYVSKLASQHVKVLLSGEGGDEAFGGYPNYTNMLRLDKIARSLGPLARAAGFGAECVGRLGGNRGLVRYGKALGAPLADNYFSRTSHPVSPFNRGLATLLRPDVLQATALESPSTFIRQTLNGENHRGLLNQMLYIDTMTWLPDDLLVKADKITMANSVELRVPLLDHKVLEFAASLPPEFKTKGKETKRALKAAFAKALPPEVLNRKKAGFPVPYQSWLNAQLKGRIEETLLSRENRIGDFFELAEVEKYLRKGSHSGPAAKTIFSMLTIELWLQKFIPARASASSSASSNSYVHC